MCSPKGKSSGNPSFLPLWPCSITVVPGLEPVKYKKAVVMEGSCMSVLFLWQHAPHQPVSLCAPEHSSPQASAHDADSYGSYAPLLAHPHTRRPKLCSLSKARKDVVIDGSSMSAPVSMRLSSPRSILCTSINSSASRCPGLSSFCTAEERIHHIFSCPGLSPFCAAEENSSLLILPWALVRLCSRRNPSRLFQLRADQMPGPPWEGQLMCTHFLSMHPSAQRTAAFTVARRGHLLGFTPYDTSHSHPYT